MLSWMTAHLHNTVRRMRILILLDILLQLRKRTLGALPTERTPRIPRQKLIHDLAQQLMRHQRRVLLIADDDPRHSFTSCVGVEGVRLLFDVLSLAGPCALRDGLGEEGHEFADAGAGEAGVGGEIAFGAEFDGGLVFIAEDLVCIVSREGWWGWQGSRTPM